MNTQIAKALNVQENQIIEVREWVFVFWVKVANRRPTLVSKKVVKMSLIDNPPSLEGSEKQIVWANEIRAEVIKKMEIVLKTEKQKQGLEKILAKKTKAAYWIDHRGQKTVEWVEDCEFA